MPIAFLTLQSGRDWQRSVDGSHPRLSDVLSIALQPPATSGGHPAGGVAHLPASGLTSPEHCGAVRCPMFQEKRSMNKRRNILFLIAIFVLLIIKAAHAQDSAPYSEGSSIQDTAHGVATTGLIFVALIGGLLAAMRVRATHLRQQRDEGGPQQLGLSQLSATRVERPR